MISGSQALRGGGDSGGVSRGGIASTRGACATRRGAGLAGASVEDDGIIEMAARVLTTEASGAGIW